MFAYWYRNMRHRRLAMSCHVFMVFDSLSHRHDNTLHGLCWTSQMHWQDQVGDNQILSRVWQILTPSKYFIWDANFEPIFTSIPYLYWNLNIDNFNNVSTVFEAHTEWQYMVDTIIADCKYHHQSHFKFTDYCSGFRLNVAPMFLQITF